MTQHKGHAMCSDINISHINVVTPLTCDGTCNKLFTTNFIASGEVKKMENRSIFGECMDKCLVFFVSQYMPLSRLPVQLCVCPYVPYTGL